MGKAIMVYGAGISGCGVAEICAGRGERVFLYNDDKKKIDDKLQSLLERQGGGFVCGEEGLRLLPEVGELLLSPGVPPDKPLVKAARDRGIAITGEAEKAFRLGCCKWIGITGTNGKTTTTTLVGEMVKSLPVRTMVGGNIGAALSCEVVQLSREDWLVAELSSFQLETVERFRPEIALILNITPDHLTRHGTMENYIAAKSNIFRGQRADDILILNYDDPLVRGLGAEARGRVCYFSRRERLAEGVFLEDGNFTLAWGGEKYSVCGVREMRIFGAHNEENALGAIACAYFAGVRVPDIAAVLRSFQGVEHRLEYVKTVKGVPYYNDSKGTNTDSTIKALEAFSGNIILIAGGRDKLTDLTEMMELVRVKTTALILIGEARERFRQAAVRAGVPHIYEEDTFEDAVRRAYALAAPPQVVLLSPACSSFDMFDNFPHRGRVFKELVARLPE